MVALTAAAVVLILGMTWIAGRWGPFHLWFGDWFVVETRRMAPQARTALIKTAAVGLVAVLLLRFARTIL